MLIRNLAGVMATLALLGSPTTATAQDLAAEAIFKNGQELLDQCTAGDADSISRCDWYIMGAWDAFGLLADLDVTERYMCLAEGTSVDVLRADVISYLRGSDTDLSKSAISNVVNAIMGAHSC